MFYQFRQNNSYGRFVFDKERGISTEVWVEADDLVEATARAEAIGLYFDGAGDCPCCGDRWYLPWDAEGSGTRTTPTAGRTRTRQRSDTFTTRTAPSCR